MPPPSAPTDRLSRRVDGLLPLWKTVSSLPQFLCHYGIIDEEKQNHAGRSQMQLLLPPQPVYDPQSHWIYGMHHPLMKGRWSHMKRSPTWLKVLKAFKVTAIYFECFCVPKSVVYTFLNPSLIGVLFTFGIWFSSLIFPQHSLNMSCQTKKDAAHISFFV